MSKREPVVLPILRSIEKRLVSIGQRTLIRYVNGEKLRRIRIQKRFGSKLVLHIIVREKRGERNTKKHATPVPRTGGSEIASILENTNEITTLLIVTTARIEPINGSPGTFINNVVGDRLIRLKIDIPFALDHYFVTDEYEKQLLVG